MELFESILVCSIRLTSLLLLCRFTKRSQVKETIAYKEWKISTKDLGDENRKPSRMMRVDKRKIENKINRKVNSYDVQQRVSFLEYIALE